jgi:hypothetical protein
MVADPIQKQAKAFADGTDFRSELPSSDITVLEWTTTATA